MKHVYLAAILCAIAATAVAQPVPSLMSYQGYLTDITGTPVSDGTFAFTFSLYENASGGPSLWTETQSSVQVRSGLFSVVLGSGNPIALAFDKPLYLGIALAGGSEYSPRVRLTTSAYSFASRVAERVLDPAMLKETEVTAGTGITVTNTGGTLQISASGTQLLQGDVLGPFSATRIADGAVTGAKIQDATISAAKIIPNIVSSVGGVKNDGGDIGLVAGSNITITPDATAHTITIAAAASPGFTLPYKGTAASTGIAFEIENTGTGSAGVFGIDNAATTKAALTASNNGTSTSADAFSAFAGNGNAVQASNSSDVSAAITANNSGNGPVARFTKTASSTGDILEINTTGGTGGGIAMTHSGTGDGINIDNNAAGDGIEVRQDGNGRAAYLHSESTSATQPAVRVLAKSTSTGAHAIDAEATGGSAINAVSDGVVPTINAVSTNSSATAPIMKLGNPTLVHSVNRGGDVWANGTSEARHFEATNSLGASATPVEGGMYKDNTCAAWGSINAAGTQLSAFGCTLSRVSTGRYRVVYKNTFSSSYDALPVATVISSGTPYICVISSSQADACEIKTYDLSGTLHDASIHVVVFGRP
ncbi:MAG: hypothetical protein IPP94_03615 [Ignavibacteria bacterium]|nr:hypothetical protein [Ignavibacteria bacterium]